jgi:hypothetical protein
VVAYLVVSRVVVNYMEFMKIWDSGGIDPPFWISALVRGK